MNKHSMNKIKKLNEDIRKILHEDLYEIISDDKEFNELFDKLIPSQGPSKTLGGELIRACNRLIYRFLNDGDQIGIGYGNETCNGAARFIQKKGSKIASDIIDELWENYNEREYKQLLRRLQEQILIDAKQNIDVPNEDDMLKYSEPSDRDYEEDDYDDDYEDFDEKLNEETLLLDKEEMQVDYIVLPPDTPIDEIKKKFPEVIFTGEEKRNEEDAIDYIRHFKKPNGIYALRIGINDNWFIGSYNSIN